MASRPFDNHARQIHTAPMRLMVAEIWEISCRNWVYVAVFAVFRRVVSAWFAAAPIERVATEG